MFVSPSNLPLSLTNKRRPWTDRMESRMCAIWTSLFGSTRTDPLLADQEAFCALFSYREDPWHQIRVCAHFSVFLFSWSAWAFTRCTHVVQESAARIGSYNVGEPASRSCLGPVKTCLTPRPDRALQRRVYGRSGLVQISSSTETYNRAKVRVAVGFGIIFPQFIPRLYHVQETLQGSDLTSNNVEPSINWLGYLIAICKFAVCVKYQVEPFITIKASQLAWNLSIIRTPFISPSWTLRVWLL